MLHTIQFQSSPLSFHETIHVEESARWERQSMAWFLAKLDQCYFVTALTLGSLVFTRESHPSPTHWQQASHHPADVPVTWWGKSINAILAVLPCSSQCIFFHIGPNKQDINVPNTDVWQQKHSKLLFPSLQQALCSTGPRTERENCTYAAATVLPTGITGAEDGSDFHVQTSGAAFARKREFLPKWEMSDRAESRAVTLRAGRQF